MIYLYIDPGTGSMLFSILIAAVATISFAARALWLKLRIFFSKKNDKTVQLDSSYKQYVIYNEGNQYWNVFKPVCDEFEKRKIELTFFTSSKTDPVFEANYIFVKPEYIGEGNAAFAKLNLLSAGFVLMTTPGLQVYQLKRSKRVKHYSHILHMPSDATTYRLFGLDFFDSILLTGDYQKEDIRLLEQQRQIPPKELITVGCTYLDVYKDNIKKISSEVNPPFTVLVSPSWGDVGILKKYGRKLLDPLVQTGWRIIIRPHPQSKKSESNILSYLQDFYKNEKNIEWDYERENIYSLKKANIMISDFSGILFDYSFLFDKPVLYIKNDLDLRPYDAFDLGDKELWMYSSLKKFGKELKEEDFTNIKNIIQSINNNKDLSSARAKAKAESWMYEGNAGKNVVDYMIKTLKE